MKYEIHFIGGSARRIVCDTWAVYKDSTFIKFTRDNEIFLHVNKNVVLFIEKIS